MRHVPSVLLAALAVGTGAQALAASEARVEGAVELGSVRLRDEDGGLLAVGPWAGAQALLVAPLLGGDTAVRAGVAGGGRLALLEGGAGDLAEAWWRVAVGVERPGWRVDLGVLWRLAQGELAAPLDGLPLVVAEPLGSAAWGAVQSAAPHVAVEAAPWKRAGLTARLMADPERAFEALAWTDTPAGGSTLRLAGGVTWGGFALPALVVEGRLPLAGPLLLTARLVGGLGAEGSGAVGLAFVQPQGEDGAAAQRIPRSSPRAYPVAGSPG